MKDWEAPRLIALVRGRPEEMILSGCKVANEGPVSPASTVTGCHEAT